MEVDWVETRRAMDRSGAASGEYWASSFRVEAFLFWDSGSNELVSRFLSLLVSLVSQVCVCAGVCSGPASSC